MAARNCEDIPQKLSHSDELLRVPFLSENSKFLITNADNCIRKEKAPDICKVEESSVLARVKSFLPKMKEAERMLEKKMQLGMQAKLDIEAVDENSPYIKMNLAVVETQGSDSEASCVDSDYSFDSDVDDECQIRTLEVDCGPVTQENFVITRTAGNHEKPVIEEVSSKNGKAVEAVTNVKKRKDIKQRLKKRKR